MAKRTISLFFTSLRTPTFKLLKLDLKPEYAAAPRFFLFGEKPSGCPSNTPAWSALAATPKTNRCCHTVSNIRFSLSVCHSSSSLSVCGVNSPETASQKLWYLLMVIMLLCFSHWPSFMENRLRKQTFNSHPTYELLVEFHLHWILFLHHIIESRRQSNIYFFTSTHSWMLAGTDLCVRSASCVGVINEGHFSSWLWIRLDLNWAGVFCEAVGSASWPWWKLDIPKHHAVMFSSAGMDRNSKAKFQDEQIVPFHTLWLYQL